MWPGNSENLHLGQDHERFAIGNRTGRVCGGVQ